MVKISRAIHQIKIITLNTQLVKLKAKANSKLKSIEPLTRSALTVTHMSSMAMTLTNKGSQTSKIALGIQISSMK